MSSNGKVRVGIVGMGIGKSNARGDAARELVDATERSGDVNMMSLNQRYSPLAQYFQDKAAEGFFDTEGGAQLHPPVLSWNEDGMIKCLALKGGYLATEAQFEDFELQLEYRTLPDVNSGVFFRWSHLADPVHTGLEIQILDTYDKTDLGNHDSGALYDLVPPKVNAVTPAGEWNTLHLKCQGPSIECDLNGQRVLDVDIDAFDTVGVNPDGGPNKFKYAWKTMPRRGHIGLQDHNGVIWFRNLCVCEL